MYANWALAFELGMLKSDIITYKAKYGEELRRRDSHSDFVQLEYLLMNYGAMGHRLLPFKDLLERDMIEDERAIRGVTSNKRKKLYVTYVRCSTGEKGAPDNRSDRVKTEVACEECSI